VSYRLPYEPALDGLRGLAVLAVMVFHAVPTGLPGGFLGVDIFFALSGYLITRLLLLEYDASRRVDLARFYTRRWVRLGPALLLMLCVYAITLGLFSQVATWSNEGVDIGLAALYMTNWTRALQLKESVDLGHTWSLAVEQQFYIVWPIVLWLFLRLIKRNDVLLLMVVALALLSCLARHWLFLEGAPIARLYNGLDTRIETILWGAALAVWLNGKSNELVPKLSESANRAVLWPGFLGILISFGMVDWTSDGYYQWGISGTAFLAVLLIGCLIKTKDSSLKKLLSQRWLVWLGTVSYGLYLWHFPIYKLLMAFDITEWRLLLLGGLLTLPVASLSYYAMERPLLNFQSRKSI
jgi:peptidoglycan/LPS O-acetylase OafA/YrhL